MSPLSFVHFSIFIVASNSLRIRALSLSHSLSVCAINSFYYILFGRHGRTWPYFHWESIHSISSANRKKNSEDLLNDSLAHSSLSSVFIKESEPTTNTFSMRNSCRSLRCCLIAFVPLLTFLCFCFQFCLFVWLNEFAHTLIRCACIGCVYVCIHFERGFLDTTESFACDSCSEWIARWNAQLHPLAIETIFRSSSAPSFAFRIHQNDFHQFRVHFLNRLFWFLNAARPLRTAFKQIPLKLFWFRAPKRFPTCRIRADCKKIRILLWDVIWSRAPHTTVRTWCTPTAE